MLGRLGVDIEKQFAIAGEVLFLFTPYDDLQRRTFNALTQRLRTEVAKQQVGAHGSVRFTPDPSVALLWAPDPMVRPHLESWNLESGGSLVAAIPNLHEATTDGRGEVIRSLKEILVARDLYRGRNPVTGNDFFGRQDLLTGLRAELSAGRSVGLFGLRRAGKTSVLREFQRRNRTARIAVVLSDLEAIDNLAEVPALLASDIANTLRELKESDDSVWLGSEGDQRVSGFAELSARIMRVAEKNRQYKFVIALDEVESLAPHVAEDPHLVRAFLGSLRKVSQGAENVALLLTGVTTRFFDESMLTETVENPLFGSIEEVFLRPFSLEETSNLVRKLGKSMVLEWDDDALNLLHASAGGFPFLVRDLASAIRGEALKGLGDDSGSEPIAISRATVERALPEWSESASVLWQNIVSTLATHHDLMAEMVRCATDRDLAAWLEVGAEAQAAAKALSGLGLLTRNREGWVRSSALISMQTLGSRRRLEASEVRAAQLQREGDKERIERLAKLIEDNQVEFKSTAKLNTRTGQADKAMGEEVVITVAAFMNSQGGTLLIGVARDGSIAGIAGDLKLYGGDLERYSDYLNTLLCTAIGPTIVSQFVDYSFVDIGDVLVCEVIVKPSSEPVWVEIKDQDAFYRRYKGQSQKLPGREVQAYLAERFPSN